MFVFKTSSSCWELKVENVYTFGFVFRILIKIFPKSLIKVRWKNWNCIREKKEQVVLCFLFRDRLLKIKCKGKSKERLSFESIIYERSI